MQASDSLVQVDILELCLSFHDLVLAFSTPAYGTGVVNGEIILPETDTGIG